MKDRNVRALLFVIVFQFVAQVYLMKQYAYGQKRFQNATLMIDILSDNLKSCLHSETRNGR